MNVNFLLHLVFTLITKAAITLFIVCALTGATPSRRTC